MYRISILPQAAKDLDALRGKFYSNLKNKIAALSANPRPFGSLKLTQEEGYRLRIGDFRIVYRIDDKSKIIFIYRIKHRKEVYR